MAMAQAEYNDNSIIWDVYTFHIFYIKHSSLPLPSKISCLKSMIVNRNEVLDLFKHSDYNSNVKSFKLSGKKGTYEYSI